MNELIALGSVVLGLLVADDVIAWLTKVVEEGYKWGAHQETIVEELAMCQTCIDFFEDVLMMSRCFLEVA